MSEGVYLYRVLHTKGCDSIIYRIGDVVIIQKEKEKIKTCANVYARTEQVRPWMLSYGALGVNKRYHICLITASKKIEKQ
jgi:hypothetical protein